MKKRISAIMNIIISVFLLIAVQTFLHPCKGDMAMPCNYSTTAAILVLLSGAADAEDDAVRRILAGMTLHEKVCQLFIVQPEQFSTALSPMDVTLGGIVSPVKPEQPLNAFPLMSVTFGGIVSVPVSPLQP